MALRTTEPPPAGSEALGAPLGAEGRGPDLTSQNTFTRSILTSHKQRVTAGLLPARYLRWIYPKRLPVVHLKSTSVLEIVLIVHLYFLGHPKFGAPVAEARGMD